MINRIKLQLILAFFWFISAYLITGAILPWEWAWRCAWINLIIGMLGLLMVSRTEEGERLFYFGPKDDEEGSLRIAMLWVMPAVILCIAAIWWLMRLIGLFGRLG